MIQQTSSIIRIKSYNKSCHLDNHIPNNREISRSWLDYKEEKGLKELHIKMEREKHNLQSSRSNNTFSESLGISRKFLYKIL